MSSDADANALPQRPRAIVGIGASAGGIDAMKRFLAALPAGSGLGIVLVMHLRPDHHSQLAEVLQQASALPVVEAIDSAPVNADTVHVIPPDRALTLEGGRLRLVPLEGRVRYGLIDRFFEALAIDQGDRAVCVVLSGAGSDGTIGLRAVKEHGGMALASATAPGSDTPPTHDSMPRTAAETGLADHVVPVGEMPALIQDYVRRLDRIASATSSGESGPDVPTHLPEICRRILHRTGHDLRNYKTATLVRRIKRRMQALRIDDAAAYLDRLDTDPQEIDALHADILIGVTSFFRDPGAFQVLERKIVPDLVARAGPGVQGVRVWVPGCGSGEEAYSIAILLYEAFERQGLAVNAQVFGTDVDLNGVQYARAGKYTGASVEHLGEERLRRHFVDEGDGLRVAPSIRDMCLFSEHDLIRHPPFLRVDLISCRNLLIYMNAELQSRLMPLFHYALNPEGYLFLGGSESLGQHADLFSELDKKHRIFKRRDATSARLPDFPLTQARAPRSIAEQKSAPDQSIQQRLNRKAERLVLEQFAPPFVIVSARYEAVYFSEGVGRYLEPPVGEPRNNLLDMAREPLRPAIRRALREAAEQAGGVASVSAQVGTDGEARTIELDARMVSERRGGEHMLLLVFKDPAPPRPSGPAAQPAPWHTEELQRELSETRDELKTTVEELEASNEELQSANEELLSMNEELQSSNEELETSKEEVQSANEELERINDKLREKVDELNRANDDRRNLMKSTRIATVFLDREQRIKWFTPDARRLFNLTDGSVGQPFTEISGNLRTPPARELARTLESAEPVERQVHLADGSGVFMMRLLPYYNAEGSIDGLVLTFIDVTQLREATSDLSALMDLVPVGIALTRGDPPSQVQINRRGRHILGLRQGGPGEVSIDDLRQAFRLDPQHREVDTRLPLEAAAQGDWVDEVEAWVHEQGFGAGEARDAALTAGGERAVLLSAAPLGKRDERARGAIMAFADITELKTSQRRQRLLLSALQHRVRNMLANIRAITNETLSNSQTLEAFEERFEGRLDALALTENITSRSGRGSIDLDELARELVATEPDAETITIEGPDVALEPRAAQILALALNELKTNAIKHGALIDGSGRVTLRWGLIAEDTGRELLRIRWQETGAGDLPAHSHGFGRELIERGVPHELGGAGQMWSAHGTLTCLLDIPLTPNVLSIGAGDDGTPDPDTASGRPDGAP